MYAGIDLGGTKTLIAALDKDANIFEQKRFETPKKYDNFISEVTKNVAGLTTNDFSGCVVGIPGLVDRNKGTVLALGNLPWRDKPIKNDIADILGGLPVAIENDARLAGLSEAQLIKDQYKSVLFVTVSTGIGGALVNDGKIVAALEDTELGHMPLYFEGKVQDWEDFAGGRAVVSRLKKRADDITDPSDWQKVAEPIAYGLAVACTVLQPEAIVLGGSVGAHADKYSAYIMTALKKRLHAVVRQPKVILAAKRPDEAVIYGCYDLAKQIYG